MVINLKEQKLENYENLIAFWNCPFKDIKIQIISKMANLQVQVNFLENGGGGFYPFHAGYKYSVRTRRNNIITIQSLLNVKNTPLKI